ncbi:ABC transporter substrate-binding protein [Terrarubrum flagellatum]|uniref:ABC transporter substrate-binding protein n=1 Tax=Terrirubrum flagellatum TaxID=2895980 RepID=UPI00314557FF
MTKLSRRTLGAFSLGAFAAAASPVYAADKLTYLFPAPDFLPAFAPFHLARAKGYYKAEDLDVDFQVGKGGADVSKQVALNNVEIGGATVDTVMVVRANGLPVKAVAQLGNGALYQIVVRKDANVKKLADLKGKKVGVLGFQDNGFYNLQGALATVGLTRDDVSIQAVGPAGVVQLMISGDLQAISAVPESTAAIEAAGVPVDVYLITEFFPGMAQAIVASEDTIRKRPDTIRKFVRATLKAVRDIEANPDEMAKEYVAAVTQHAGKEASIADIFRRYGRLVYRTKEAELGTFDAARVQTMADFYVKAGILPQAAKASDMFTNEFIGR